MFEICSKLTIKILREVSDVSLVSFIVYFEQISKMTVIFIVYFGQVNVV